MGRTHSDRINGPGRSPGAAGGMALQVGPVCDRSPGERTAAGGEIGWVRSETGPTALSDYFAAGATACGWAGGVPGIGSGRTT